MATAALEEGVITPRTTFYCPGYLSIYGTVFRCNKAGRPRRRRRRSRRSPQSCNVFFYQVGVRLEIERIARWAKMLGLGAPTGVDLPHEAAGPRPEPRMEAARPRRCSGTPGETVSVAIGQGQVTVTPLQMARVAGVRRERRPPGAARTW